MRRWITRRKTDSWILQIIVSKASRMHLCLYAWVSLERLRRNKQSRQNILSRIAWLEGEDKWRRKNWSAKRKKMAQSVMLFCPRSPPLISGQERMQNAECRKSETLPNSSSSIDISAWELFVEAMWYLAYWSTNVSNLLQLTSMLVVKSPLSCILFISFSNEEVTFTALCGKQKFHLKWPMQ